MKRIVLLGLVLLASCKKVDPPVPVADAGSEITVELTSEGLATAHVRTEKVGPGTFTPRLRLAGSIVGDPKHVAEVGARVSGRVVAIRVVLGDRVKRGQVLAEVDTVELHQVVLEYRTAVAKAKSAQDTLARQKQLVDERVGPIQDLRRAEAAAAEAEAALTESREHLKFLGLTDTDVAQIRTGTGDAKSRIMSPIDGRVAMLNLTPGQVLTGSETIAVIADLDPIWAQVRVYERDLQTIRPDAAATVAVPAYPDRTFDGTIAFVSDVLDSKSRSAEVRIRLVNEDGALRPGMSANAFTARRAGDQSTWLPVAAVQPHEGARIVFVRTGERRFQARRVIVGEEQGDYLPVESGLGPDDDVVVEGAFTLRGELERAALAGE
ncbi:MAG: efflux RND transporter periplasmic adaptor subunit [Polyangiaceae bacterium]|nr:efflux RND transporter periplasmic adaptor subunit [Polyangiaceae bacterium]